MKEHVLTERILKLKREKNAIILAHNYQRPEIYDVADYIGDSLGLCEKARDSDAEIIVFSGVYFMAESAAILNPSKKVLIPAKDAGCALSDMITADALREKKKEYPNAAVVAYINCTADVKAEADIMCTSSNAAEVCRSLPHHQILFVPDKNLANFVQKQVPEKEIIPWEGFCPIHHRITPEYILQAMANHPRAKLIVHPECTEEVIAISDYCVSTSKMIQIAEEDPAEEFLIITECGMVNRMKQAIPNKKFYTVCSVCFDMKKNTLEKIEESLLTGQHEVIVPEPIRIRAYQAFERMFALRQGGHKTLGNIVLPTLLPV